MKNAFRACLLIIMALMLAVLSACSGGQDTDDGAGGGSDGADKEATVRDEQGLIYTLKEDGSYSVRAEGDIKLARLVIAEELNGCAVSEIEDNAFIYTVIDFEAEEILIPSSIKRIGKSAFSGAENIKRVYISDLRAWCSTELENAYSNPLSYAEELYVNGESVEDLIIPDGVSEIGKNAFAYFSGLRTLIIPDSVLLIGEGAFSNCKSLRRLDVGCGVIKADYAFVGCTRLTDIINKSKTRIIGGNEMNTIDFDNGKTRIVGHAGLAGVQMQNTMEAFEYAARRSYYGIETDIRRTSDGHFVCFHDPSLMTAAGVDNTIELMTLDEIREVTLFDQRGGDTKECGYKIPTLEEYVGICKKYGKECFIELKTVFKREDVFAIIEVIRSLGYLDRCTFISFYYDDLSYVKEAIPDARVGFNFTSEQAQTRFDDIISDGFDVLISATVITEEQIKTFHELGRTVITYTVNQAERAEELVGMGVDYILTDKLE